MKHFKIPVVAMLVAGLGLVSLTGCTGAQKGAAYGGATGAGLGAIIGHQSGSTGEGALIGAAAGGLLGALMGDAVEESNKRKVVERETVYVAPEEKVRYEEVLVGYRTVEVVEPVYVPPQYKYVEFVGYDDEGNEYRETKRVLVKEGHYENRTVTKEEPIYERVQVKVR